jgi:hypothetical protein
MYSRGYKKRAIAEKIFETLAIFSCSDNVVFWFFRFFWPNRFACERIYFYTQDTAATIEGLKSHLI